MTSGFAASLTRANNLVPADRGGAAVLRSEPRLLRVSQLHDPPDDSWIITQHFILGATFGHYSLLPSACAPFGPVACLRGVTAGCAWTLQSTHAARTKR